jgi:hypothetical protein
MEWALIGIVFSAFVASQLFHNRADDVRESAVIREDSRRQGRKAEQLFLWLAGIAILLWLVGRL